MGLRAAAGTINVQRPGPSCGFGKILASLDPEDLAYYHQLIEEGALTSYITKVFNADGHTTSEYTVGRHRRGICKC
jgi:hypothetical protein